MSEKSTGKSQNAEDVRERILTCARDLFLHYGYFKTAIRDIAACCEMSPGNIYRHFRNKEAIGLELSRAYFAETEAIVEAAVEAAKTPEDKIRQAIEVCFEVYYCQFEAAPKLIEITETLKSSAGDVLREHVAWKRALLARVLEDGKARGLLQFKDAEEIASSLMLATEVFWSPDRVTICGGEDAEPRPMLRLILDTMIAGLRRG